MNINISDESAGMRSYKLKVSSITSYNVPLNFDRDSAKMKREKCGDFWDTNDFLFLYSCALFVLFFLHFI